MFVLNKPPQMNVTGYEVDSEGNPIDCITCESIPANKLVIVREGNAVYCFNVETLLRSLVISGDDTNPFTRTKLPEEVLAQIEKYRASTSYLVTVMDIRMTGTCPPKKITFSMVDKVGDLVISCAESILPLPELLTVTMKCKGRNMSDVDFNMPITEFESTPVLTIGITSGGPRQQTSALGMKIKEYASSTSRYQHITGFHSNLEVDDSGEADLEGTNDEGVQFPLQELISLIECVNLLRQSAQVPVYSPPPTQHPNGVNITNSSVHISLYHPNDHGATYPAPQQIDVPFLPARQLEVRSWLPSWYSHSFLNNANLVWYPLMENYSPENINEGTQWTLLDSGSISAETLETNINVAAAFDLMDDILSFNDRVEYYGGPEPHPRDYPRIEPAINVIRYLGRRSLPLPSY